MAACRSCGAELLWGTNQQTGKRMPLDVKRQSPREGLVAFNPQTEGAHVLSAEDVADGTVAAWMTKGVTCHSSHFSTCPDADKFRKRR